MAGTLHRSTAIRDRFRAQARRRGDACHICGQLIDYDLPHLDPMSFQADHKIPLKRGGTDTPDNLAASHRTCNSTKRARAYAPIVRRSGSLNA